MFLTNYSKDPFTHYIILIQDYNNNYFSAGLSSWCGTTFFLESPSEDTKFRKLLEEIKLKYNVEKSSPPPAISRSIENALHLHSMWSPSILIGLNINTQDYIVIKEFTTFSDIQAYKEEYDYIVKDVKNATF